MRGKHPHGAQPAQPAWRPRHRQLTASQARAAALELELAEAEKRLQLSSLLSKRQNDALSKLAMENASLLALLSGMPALRQRPVPEDGSRPAVERVQKSEMGAATAAQPGRASTPPLPRLGNMESLGFGDAYEGLDPPVSNAQWTTPSTPPRAGAGPPNRRKSTCGHSKAPSSRPTPTAAAAAAAQRSPRVR